jgi:circadian clock protein KaiC
MHLLLLYKLIKEFSPRTVIVDPISSLITVGTESEVRAMLVRLLDMLKGKEISALFTSLTHAYSNNITDLTEDVVSSLADTWIKLRNEEKNMGRVRSLIVVKSRGMAHSNKVTNFSITDKGIVILNEKNNQDQISSKKKRVK